MERRALWGSHPIIWPMMAGGKIAWDFDLGEVERAGSPGWGRDAGTRAGTGQRGMVDGRANPGCAAGRGHALKPGGCLQPQTLTWNATFSGFEHL